MQLYSQAFENDEPMPKVFSCDGRGISPPLSIADVPENAQSLVLILEDPDAPLGTFIHWTMWNISPNTAEIPEGGFVDGAIEGITSSGGQGYIGPCPPSGAHRYFFNLYALDVVLDIGADSDHEALGGEMQDHIIEMARLQTSYQRQ